MSIKVTLPDGQVREFPAGTTSLQVAQSISPGLAKKVLAAMVNGVLRDAGRPIETDARLFLLTWNEAEGKSVFWHSSAHLMAEALEEIYPGIKFGIGPPVDHGFYYDVDAGNHEIRQDDLEKIEKKMLELASRNSAYVRKEVSKNEAVEYFTKKGDEYKLELISELNDGEISFYQQGNFVDLCRGPHLPDTSFIKAVKLTNIAGAYWRGDSSNKQMTRLYGITFPRQKEMDEFLQLQEEQKKRDHRKIGKELEIFTFDDDVGPGLPLWMPNGAAMIEVLESLAKKTEDEQGYYRVKTPHIAKESMYVTSGHLPYYADSMFPPMEMEGVKYYLKSMNCPHHHKIYSAVPRSHKDLPLRLAEYGTCYRYEQSGELFGLMRVRSLQMNDAHIYCTEQQFEQEFRNVNEMYLKYFKLFGIEKYVMRFSRHDPSKLGKKYLDMPELWKHTEELVKRVLISSNIPYVEVQDEAAFYGPKIDVQIWSAIGREFTLATNQVDFGQPLRFGLTFQNADNKPETPLVIHRAPLGTHERFIGFLIEHYAGNFPAWIAPRQIAILTIADRHEEWARQVAEQLRNERFRVSVDSRSDKIGKKIRDAEIKKTPCMLIIGDQELQHQKVSVRRHGSGDTGSLSIPEFIQKFKMETEVF